MRRARGSGPWTERSGPWATGGNDLGARRNGRGIGDSETKHGRQQSEAQEGSSPKHRKATPGCKEVRARHRRQRNKARKAAARSAGKSGQGTAVSNQNERIQTVHGPTHSGRLGRPKASQPTRSRQPVRTNPLGPTRPVQGTPTDTLATTPPDQPIRVDSSGPRHPNRHARDNPSGPLPGPMREKSAADENIHPQCARRLDLFSYFCKK